MTHNNDSYGGVQEDELMCVGECQREAGVCESVVNVCQFVCVCKRV